MAEPDGFVSSLSLSESCSVTWYQCRQPPRAALHRAALSYAVEKYSQEAQIFADDCCYEVPPVVSICPLEVKCSPVAFGGRCLQQSIRKATLHQRGRIIFLAPNSWTMTEFHGLRSRFRNHLTHVYKKLIISRSPFTLISLISWPASQDTVQNSDGSQHTVELWTTERQTVRLVQISSVKLHRVLITWVLIIGSSWVVIIWRARNSKHIRL